MFDTKTLMWLIPALPLTATLVIAALGKTVLREKSHRVAVLATAGSFLLSVVLLFQVQSGATRAIDAGAAGDTGGATERIGYEVIHTLWTWVNVEDAYQLKSEPGAEASPRDFNIEITLRADPLTSIMLVMVTFVSTLVVIYSIGYMKGDPGYWRFFTYVSLFVFSMTMLVSASNFLLLYVFWEAVGACSYLLIGFWFEKPAASAAGKKAFLVNRIGDFGFALGIFFIWTTLGTLNFHDVPALGVDGVLGQTMLAHPERYEALIGGGLGLTICLLLFLGACGKSAQFPLHVWLPDAMEGPTPVSALIHAATMVTAGVYMVARCTPLFFAFPDALTVVAVVGCFTALMAGLIAMTQTDLKRILAYSTISQLGYMFLGLGVGTVAGITAAMFHLFTHAFFKALLFLGAGSVMHAMGGVIDIRRFGGLRRLMPYTHWTFLIGSLALAGIPIFAGFWSKDAIIAAVHDRHHDGPLLFAHLTLYEALYYVALFTALLTAFYTFRAYFSTFFGPLEIPREAGSHAHESPPVMWWPLAILAVLATVVGAYFEATHGFVEFLTLTPQLAYETAQQNSGALGVFHPDVALMSAGIALLGVGVSAFLYLGNQTEVNFLARMARKLYLYQLSHGKFFFDPIYNFLFVAPIKILAAISYWFDRHIVDGLVNFVGRVPWRLGSGMRVMQNGLVQFYALSMILGLVVLLLALSGKIVLGG